MALSLSWDVSANYSKLTQGGKLMVRAAARRAPARRSPHARARVHIHAPTTPPPPAHARRPSTSGSAALATTSGACSAALRGARARAARCPPNNRAAAPRRPPARSSLARFPAPASRSCKTMTLDKVPKDASELRVWNFDGAAAGRGTWLHGFGRGGAGP